MIQRLRLLDYPQLGNNSQRFHNKPPPLGSWPAPTVTKAKSSAIIGEALTFEKNTQKGRESALLRPL
jgi:hypothetical protein